MKTHARLQRPHVKDKTNLQGQYNIHYVIIIIKSYLYIFNINGYAKLFIMMIGIINGTFRDTEPQRQGIPWDF